MTEKGKIMNENLPVEVVETDHRLESTARRASEALAKHRWHWTLDESNPNRVSFRAYARAVGRGEVVVRTQVNGYAEWISRTATSARSLSESIERAKMGDEKATATEAVATARGAAFGHTRKARPEEIKRVRQIARERAEERGTTVEEEAPKVAQAIVRSEQAEARQTEQRKQQHTLRFVTIEGKLARMLRVGTEILTESYDVPFSEEERELLAESIAKVRALLGLIDMRFTDTSGVDWDTELTKIVGE